MGKYINHTSKGFIDRSSMQDKCDAIIEDGAIEINQPKEYVENLVCVVDNIYFAAAAYAHSESEMNSFLRSDGRTKRWFIWDKVSNFAL